MTCGAFLHLIQILCMSITFSWKFESNLQKKLQGCIRWKITIHRGETWCATYTLAHQKWRTKNATCKHAISPILLVFWKYYLGDAIMLIKPNMVRPWATGNEHSTANVCRMRERIRQDVRTSFSDTRTFPYCSLGLLLLTWIICNPGIL